MDAHRTAEDLTGAGPEDGALRELKEECRRLEQRVRLLHTTLSQLPHFACAFDREGRFAHANQPLLDLWGLTPEEVLGKSLRELAGADEPAAKLQRQLRQVFDTGRGLTDEARFTSPSGAGGFYEYTLRPVFDAGGAVELVAGTARDVTRHRQAEASLRDREHLLRHLTRNIPGGSINVFDRDFRYLFAEGQGLSVVGMSSEGLVGRTLSELFEPEAVEYVTPFYRRALAGETLDFELEVGGQWFIINAAPLEDAQGQVNALIAVAQNITERKRAEERLRYQLHLTETITDRAAEALFLIDGCGRVTFMNPAAEAMFGWPKEELLGKVLHDVIHHRRPDGTPYPIADCPLGLVMTSGDEVHGHEDVFYARGGGAVYVRCSNAPVFENGRITGGVLVISDVTADREAEAERARLLGNEQRLRAEAEEANRLKDEFLATVSHELRTPLTAIYGWAHMLENGAADPETARHAVKVIMRNAEQQRQIIDDILDVSRVITGKLQLESGRAEMAQVVQAAVDTVRPAAEAKGVRLSAHFDGDAAVTGDPHRLQQVVWNLLSNAVKFTPPGGEVRARVERLPAGVRVAVSDTGQGISPGFLPHVFDRFRQADQSRTRRHGGLGLGLAIVRHLVEIHGGSVRAESAGEGQGATFTIDLPLSADAEPAPADGWQKRAGRTPPAPAGEDAEGGRRPPLAGVRALLVDDDADALEMLSALLGRGGAEVTAVSSAGAALGELERAKPDVIVADVGMPEVDGHELIRKVRSLEAERGGRTPAIAVTAYAGEADRALALDSGFQAHLPKPVEPEALIAAIINLAGRDGRR